jgi:hypothetical protein
MSDIDVEVVVDAVAPFKQMQTGRELLPYRSPSANEYTRQNYDEDDVQQHKRKRRQIERNRDARQ